MSGNSFGKLLKLTSFGESHGAAIGGVIDGFPAGFEINFDKLKSEVGRRKPTKSSFSTQRNEDDEVEFLSGIYQSKTLGLPIAFIIRNTDAQAVDYEKLKHIFRPSHADFVWQEKFKIRDYRGGGRSSARETVARVVAGALAQQFLEKQNIKIVAVVTSIGKIKGKLLTTIPTKEEVDSSILRCADKEAEILMIDYLQNLKAEKDSAGGTVSAYISGLPIGLGEPVFDKFQARLAAAMMSINTAKGFEYGEGFASAKMKGSEHNDYFTTESGKIHTSTNHAGGINGGISNGEIVNFKVAFKPIASIGKIQKTVDDNGNQVDIEISGRHDLTVLPRVVPIVEAMTALVVMDLLLLMKTNK